MICCVVVLFSYAHSHTGRITALTSTHHDSLVASCGMECMVQLWSIDKLKQDAETCEVCVGANVLVFSLKIAQSESVAVSTFLLQDSSIFIRV